MQEKLEMMSRDILDLSEAVAHMAQSNEERFNAIDQRFVATDQRFESIDQRFKSIDQHFEFIDQRFDTLEHRINASESKILNKLDELFSSHHGDAVATARGEVKRHEVRLHATS